LVLTQDNVSECSYMSIHGLLFFIELAL